MKGFVKDDVGIWMLHASALCCLLVQVTPNTSKILHPRKGLTERCHSLASPKTQHSPAVKRVFNSASPGSSRNKETLKVRGLRSCSHFHACE